MADSGSGTWRLRLLDHVGLSGPAGDAGLTAGKAVALLIFLALQRDRTARRDTIANLLWENVDTAQGRVNLRQAIAAVRRAEAGGPPIFEADPESLKLSAAVVADLDRFEALSSGGVEERRAAAELYNTDLAAGFAVRDAPAFNEWLTIAQAQWRQRAVAVLMSLADEAVAPGGDLNAGAAAALKLLAIDPLNEAGHRALMRIYARQGRAALALAQYRSLADLLRRELQVAPDAETQALYEAVRSGRRQAGVASNPPTVNAGPVASIGQPILTVATSPEHGPVVSQRDDVRAAPARTRRRRGAAVAAAFVLVLAIGGALLWRVAGARAAAAPRIARIFPVASTDEQETAPALSPDGGSVVYSMKRGGNIDLYFAQIEDQGDPVRLTSHPADDVSAAWRPDGHAIAFVRAPPRGDAPCAILVRSMPRGAERVLGACRTLHTTEIAWAADGSAIYFRDDADPDRVSQIFRLSVAGGPAVAITHPPENVFGDYDPALSRDGRRLSLVRAVTIDSSEIVVQDLAAKDIRVQGGRMPFLRDAVWSRDDRGLIYSVVEGAHAGLWWRALGRDDPPTRLSTGLLSYSDLSYSASRNRLVFQVSQDRRSMGRLPADATNAAALQPIAGLRSEISDRFVAQARDGRLAVVSGRSGTDELWIKSGASPLRRITRGGGLTFAAPEWSPNGKYIAVSGSRDGRSDIYLVDARSGRMVKVTHDEASDAYPSWSADGRYLLWSSLRGGVSSVWLVEPARPGRAPRQLAGTGVAEIRAGPPGDDSYYYKRWSVPGLFRRAFGASGDFTGPETLIVPNLPMYFLSDWTLAGATIVYRRRDAETGATFLHRYDLRTRRDVRIEGSDALSGRLALSAAADGGVLATRTTVQDDISGIDFE